jgi:hypothetical protein
VLPTGRDESESDVNNIEKLNTVPLEGRIETLSNVNNNSLDVSDKQSTSDGRTHGSGMDDNCTADSFTFCSPQSQVQRPSTSATKYPLSDEHLQTSSTQSKPIPGRLSTG